MIEANPVPGPADVALSALLPRLVELPDADVVRPHTDPHAAAVTALLVADWLRRPEIGVRAASAGFTIDDIRELAALARAILGLVDALGGDYLSDVIAIPTDLEVRGHAVRASTIKALESALPWNREVRMWLEAIRMGSGLVDLVYDLRALAELLVRHREAMPNNLDRLPAMLRTSSDAIEYALRNGEAEELTVARGRLARIWTLFVPAYERAASAARILSREEGAEHTFPPLALIASHRRARRALGITEESMEAEIPIDVEIESSPARTRECERERDPKKTTGSHPRTTGSRRAHRSVLELEVGIGESNFYVGFTENVSCAGIFVATYVMHPIGSKVDVALTLPGGESMRIPGIVRWQRSATEDGWPGMGVQFEALDERQRARIERFLELRAPMFYEPD